MTRIYQLSNNHTISSFSYNDKGLRHSKTTYALGIAAEDTYYSYDAGGAQVATYTRNLLLVSPTTILQSQTLYAAGRVGLLDASTGKTLFELSDHLGNVRAVVADNGSGVAETISYTDYYPHGGIMPGRNYQSSLNFPYGYQGQEKDQATGLTNFELRQYDPRIGRWYNPDPMGQHHSPYLAMSNNPVSFTDPDGGWDGDGWDFGIGANWANSSSYGSAQWASMSAYERTAAFKHYGTGTSFTNYLFTESNGDEHMANSGQGLASLYNKYNKDNGRSLAYDSQKKGFLFQEYRHTDMISTKDDHHTGDISEAAAKAIAAAKKEGFILSPNHGITYVNEEFQEEKSLAEGLAERDEYVKRHLASGAIKQDFFFEEWVIGGVVAKGVINGLGKLVSPNVIVGSGGGYVEPMNIVREIRHGEKLADLIELAQLRTMNTGVEHAIVRLSAYSVAPGARVLVSGGRHGIGFGKQISFIWGHTHPYVTGVSAADIRALRLLKQSKQYIFEGFEKIPLIAR